MTCDKVRLIDEVGGLDLRLAETQVGHRQATGLFRVIVEVSLNIHIGMVADNLNRVLVRTNRAVCTQAPEFAACDTGRRGVRILFYFKRKMRNIVGNADGEVLLLSIFIMSAGVVSLEPKP